MTIDNPTALNTEILTTPYHYGAHTDKGMVSNHNEDSFVCTGEIFAVADGVGGADYGEVASKFFCKTLVSSKNLKIAAHYSNQELLNSNEQNGTNSATTFVCAQEINPNRYSVTNVGDSPAYVFDLNSRKYREITLRDEKIGQRSNGKMGLVLTQAIGASKEINIHEKIIDLGENQVLFLCSDGFSDYLDRHKITPGSIFAVLLKSEKTPHEKSEMLVDMANQSGGKDNISVVLIFHHHP